MNCTMMHGPTNINLFNPLNGKLNPICHLLALLGVHHILHVSRIRVKLIVFYQKLLYVQNSFMTCSVSKVLLCFGVTICKEIKIQIK